MPYFNSQRSSWMGQVRYQEKVYRRSFPSKAQAQAWERSHLKELCGKAKPPRAKKPEKEVVSPEAVPSERTGTVSLYDFAVMYLDYSKSRHAQKTYIEKRDAFRHLFKHVSPATPVDQLHRGGVLAYFTEQAAVRSGNAANKDRKNLVAAWHWAVRYIPAFPQQNSFLVDRCAETRHPRVVPSEADFWAVYSAAETDQDRVLLLAYLHLAARRSELFRLRLEDVDLDRNQVRLSTRKRRDGSQHYDWLLMSDRLASAMRQHLEVVSGPWVFPDPETGEPYRSRQHWMPRLCAKAGVKEFGLHGIRHLSASILMANNVSLVDVQGILRHMNLTTTQRYVHRLQSCRSAVAVFR